MASSPTDFATHGFTAYDGVQLVWHEIGEGSAHPPLVLIHGLFSNAFTNWIRYGHAGLLAAAGRRVIMPDLRAHGESAKPHDAASYPPDILAEDGRALIEHLGLGEYDLGGYSLGGRTVVRMLVAGIRPRRAIVAGMGLSGILDTAERGEHFRHVLTRLGSFERGTPGWMTEAFLKTTNGDPIALLHILDTFIDTPIDLLQTIETPVLVATGEDDDNNGSGPALADALGNAHFRSIPGNHMSAVMKPELGMAISDFLA